MGASDQELTGRVAIVTGAGAGIGAGSVSEERIEVPNMIGKPILDVWFSRLAEPDEIRCDAMRCRCNQGNDIPP